MTDNEIIKALECLCGVALKCRECQYSNRYQFPLCQQRVAKDTLDLINRQRAEIERLKIENQSLRMAANSYKIHYNEAVKEFAEKLKDDWWHNAYYSEDVNVLDWIDNLVKEMAGDTK